MGPLNLTPKRPFVRCFCNVRERGLERFANSSIPWDQPTIFINTQVAEVSLMFLVSPFVLPVLQYHLSQIDEAVKYSDTKINLDKLFQTQAMYP